MPGPTAPATGPAAWSDWKGRLIAELVRRVHTALDTGVLPAPPTPDPALVAGPLPAVHLDGDRVAVAAADRRGLLAAVAGCLALHRLDVLGADASTVDGRALVEFLVAAPVRHAARPDRARQRPAPGGHRRRVGDPAAAWPGRCAGRGRRAAAGGLAPGGGHRRRRAGAARGRLAGACSTGSPAPSTRPAPQVRAARISTLGGDVVDAFYLVGAWPADAERDRVEAAVLAAA